jgi:hypothetical protein
MKENELKQLIVGSKYHIFSLGSRDEPLETVGKFLGFSILGSSEAICIELDKSHKKLKGKTRMIPSHMVLALDVLSEAKDKEKPDEEGLARSYL